MTRIAIIADYDEEYQLHHDTVQAIEQASCTTGIRCACEWIATTSLTSNTKNRLSNFGGIWIAPGAPYKSLEGALNAIRFARVSEIPLLGTCSGFQHIVVEYARNVLKIKEASHAEYDPDATKPFITGFNCSISHELKMVKLVKNSMVRNIYGRDHTKESFHCKYGINPEFRAVLEEGGLETVGVDIENEPRIVMIDDHPFFVGVLFVPQALKSQAYPHPLVTAFFKKASIQTDRQVA